METAQLATGCVNNKHHAAVYQIMKKAFQLCIFTSLIQLLQVVHLRYDRMKGSCQVNTHSPALMTLKVSDWVDP